MTLEPTKIEFEAVKGAIPKSQRTLVTPEFVEKLNDMNSDPLLLDSFKENFLTYTGVLNQGKYKLEDYVYAVKFVSHKLLGDKDIDAYMKTFPHRYEGLVKQGLDRDGISPYVTAYKKNKLVIQILEQTLVPTHVLNAPLYQEALNVQVNLMYNARSEMVRQKAAESIMTATKQPENAKIELDIGFKETSAIEDLNNQLAELAQNSLKQLANGRTNLNKLGGMKTKDQLDDIIDGEVE